MKITIDTDTIEQFIDTLSDNSDEWYGPENDMTLCCIIDYFEWSKQSEVVFQLRAERERIRLAREQARAKRRQDVNI